MVLGNNQRLGCYEATSWTSLMSPTTSPACSANSPSRVTSTQIRRGFLRRAILVCIQTCTQGMTFSLVIERSGYSPNYHYHHSNCSDPQDIVSFLSCSFHFVETGRMLCVLNTSIPTRSRRVCRVIHLSLNVLEQVPRQELTIFIFA